MIKKKISLLCIIAMLCAVNCICKAQQIPPLKRSLQLTGNFGELRTNHFHTGLDFRAAIGTPVYAVDSGYVSRISVDAGGYGNALYITHPSGTTSVYAHLNSYSPKIEKILTEKQYQLKYYAVNLTFSLDEIKVAQGEVVAYTGNRGSSGGPHLHFEIRDTKTENLLDPINYIKDKIKDTRSPQIKAISVIPYNGVVNNSSNKTIEQVVVENGNKKIKTKIKAWGDILLALKAFDYMPGMNNIYGVHYVKLYKDEELIYSSHIDTLSFETGRQINSYIDTEEWHKERSLFMLSYISQANRLNFYEEDEIKNRGIITIDEERIYKFRYEVADYFGNKDICSFEIEGEESKISQSQPKLKYNKEQSIEELKFKITIPAYALYDDYTIEYTKADTLLKDNYSVIHTLEPYYAGVDKNCKLSIKIDVDTLSDKSKYYIASIHSVGKNIGKISQEYISTYQEGWLTTQVKTFGKYVVKADLTNPYLKYHGVADGEIRITVKDSESGLKYFIGEIDGQFVLFTYDIKDKIARYKIDKEKFKQGVIHTIKFVAIDNCGNKNESKFKLTY
ncbi:MAG: M23 family metallopeptidase [Bacteroidales bacterium]|nr:M23 family metallopeptidase [Bacteroidales bacterium]